MVDFSVVQDHDNSLVWVTAQHVFQERQENSRIVLVVFLHIDLTRFVVQTSHQLHTLMFPIGRDDALLPDRKPRLHDGLIIPNHGLVFEQYGVNLLRQEFFLPHQIFGEIPPAFGGRPSPMYRLAVYSSGRYGRRDPSCRVH